MASRTLGLTISEADTIGEGDKLKFNVTSGTNQAFGSHNPTSWDIDFNSEMYVNYSSSVTGKWSIHLKLNGTRYEIGDGSRTMSKSSSDFSLSDSFSSNIISLLKSYPIQEVAVYNDGTRDIKATSSATGSFTIYYNEVYASLGTPGAPKFTNNGNGTYNVSWTAASYSNGSGSPTYELWDATNGILMASAGTSTSLKNISIPSYNYQYQYRVTAYYSGLTSHSSYTNVTFASPSLSTPSGVKLSASSGVSTTLSWSASTLSNTTGTITYSIRKNGSQIATTTGTSYTFNESTTSTWGTNAVTLTVVATASTANPTYSSLTSGTSSGVSFTYVPPNPTITTQPVLSLGGTSGASISLSWTAASVSNQNGATIYYQYFVGPTSDYSDNYHIGTTASLSATITESEIISKCGTNFGANTTGSICYCFVRAYWDKNGTTGGFVAPTGIAFTYYPTVNAPTSLTLSSQQGIETTASWINHSAGNGSMPQIILFIDDNPIAYTITDYNSGYLISKDVWRTLTPGNHSVKVAHEWYGRYAYSAEVAFKYESGLMSVYDPAQGRYVRCEVKYFDSNRNQYVLCVPMLYDGGWKPCGT